MVTLALRGPTLAVHRRSGRRYGFLVGVDAGRAREFGFVVGVGRGDEAERPREHGADVVVTNLSDLLDAS